MKSYTETQKDLQLSNDMLDLTKSIDWNNITIVKEMSRKLAKRLANYVEGELLPIISSLMTRNERLEQENKLLKDKIVSLTDNLHD